MLDRSSPWLNAEALAFRDKVRAFVDRELVSNQARWRQQGWPDRDVWTKAGEAGLLLPDIPRPYGSGGTFALEAVMIEELARSATPFAFNNQTIVARYILGCGNDGQKARWLPRMARGDLIAAIAMTEPGCGSDLKAIQTTAKRDGDHYVVNGVKTFITNGWQADLVCVAVRTGPPGPGLKSLSLLVVETHALPGYRVGRPLRKIGRGAVDTCELFFDDVRVPAANLLGAQEGRGLLQMMDQLAYERMSIAVSAIAEAEHAVAATARFVKQRDAAGRAAIDAQETRFRLAECVSDVRVGRVFADDCVTRFIAGRLGATDAAMAKYWLTECSGRVIETCLQLQGEAGCLLGNPLARLWADARVERIYGGSNEIMKEMISASL